MWLRVQLWSLPNTAESLSPTPALRHGGYLCRFLWCSEYCSIVEYHSGFPFAVLQNTLQCLSTPPHFKAFLILEHPRNKIFCHCAQWMWTFYWPWYMLSQNWHVNACQLVWAGMLVLLLYCQPWFGDFCLLCYIVYQYSSSSLSTLLLYFMNILFCISE